MRYPNRFWYGVKNEEKWMANPLSSEACRKRAEECFDKDKCFERYVELYEEFLNGK